MLYDHDQCISFQRLNRSAILEPGLYNKASISNRGIIPNIESKTMPGIRKSTNGMFRYSERGMPINSPDGEMISAIPPANAPSERCASKIRMMSLVIFVFTFL